MEEFHIKSLKVGKFGKKNGKRDAVFSTACNHFSSTPRTDVSDVTYDVRTRPEILDMLLNYLLRSID